MKSALPPPIIPKRYKTAVGRFSYRHMPLPHYSFGIQQIQLTKKQTMLMASAEKALCDKIIATAGVLLRSVKQTLQLLIEDFRIDESALQKLETTTINSWLKMRPKEIAWQRLQKHFLKVLVFDAAMPLLGVFTNN
ncbi:hypothetical protein [Agriterribacter humi]|uniref:hypothetical protein n=1 Tax=Agriterribacter humi TaxID=1104781 RepID=UPI001264B55F|nr:hypothetical protein [Agriterribacter humi]